ncbi:MAG: hypothetical protein M0C28_11180 [Candidatus Moduliflexus flocculans]|nr:hypothetical protein [Candidatus Moduliflexus flocculans]
MEDSAPPYSLVLTVARGGLRPLRHGPDELDEPSERIRRIRSTPSSSRR